MEAYADREELAQCVRELLIYAPESSIAAAERLLSENLHREVQGRVCYEVAQRIAFNRRDEPTESERREAIDYLQRVVAGFADLPHWRHGTLGAAAERDLFELQHLVVGATAPETEGVDAEGEPMSLADFRGRVVVLDFWASWCGPCIGDLPALNALQEEFSESVAVLGVMSDPPETARETLAEQDVQFRNWIDGPAEDGPIVALWNVDSWPTTYVIDSQGVIRHKDVKGSALREAVWRLLQESESER